MKINKLVFGLALLPALSFAQAANISRTDIGPSVSSFNITTGWQNAQSPTYVPNDGKTVLLLKNSSGAPKSADIITEKTSVTKEGYGTITLSNERITLPSGSEVIAIGPFPTGRFNNSTGTVRVSTTITNVSATSMRVRGE